VTTGAELAVAFFTAEVRPLMERSLPGVAYLAGRLGSGSEVLGFDDDRSRDHDFGYRLTLLVDEVDAHLIAALDERLEAKLPEQFLGRPVRFPTTWDDRHRHKVEVATVEGFARSRLGVELTNSSGPQDWLSMPGQSVLEVVAGPVSTTPPAATTSWSSGCAGTRRGCGTTSWRAAGRASPRSCRWSPFSTVNADLVTVLVRGLGDPAVAALPVGIGSIDQWCDNVDLLARPERRPAVQQLYRRLLPPE
jgi:hypothetical protein